MQFLSPLLCGIWEERRRSSGSAGAKSAVTLFLVALGVFLHVCMLLLLTLCVVSRPPRLPFTWRFYVFPLYGGLGLN